MTCKFMIYGAISFIIKIVITKQYRLKLQRKNAYVFRELKDME